MIQTDACLPPGVAVWHAPTCLPQFETGYFLGFEPRFSRARLLGDDLALDLVVGRLRHDLLRDQLVLRLVGTPVDDLLGVGVADAWQGLELLLRRSIQVNGLGFWRLCHLLGLRRRAGFAVCAEAMAAGSASIDASATARTVIRFIPLAPCLDATIASRAGPIASVLPWFRACPAASAFFWTTLPQNVAVTARIHRFQKGAEPHQSGGHRGEHPRRAERRHAT